MSGGGGGVGVGGGSREEERRKLADIINHWNANRLDLFEISPPTEVREGDGEIRERLFFPDGLPPPRSFPPQEVER